jgi:hypothetical protein
MLEKANGKARVCANAHLPLGFWSSCAGVVFLLRLAGAIAARKKTRIGQTTVREGESANILLFCTRITNQETEGWEGASAALAP